MLLRFLNKVENTAVLCPTFSGVGLLVYEQIGAVIHQAQLIQNSEVNYALKNLKKTLKKLTLQLILPCSFYQTVLLENPGLSEAQLERALPWLCSDYLSYLPEEAICANISIKNTQRLYALCYSKSLLSDYLARWHLGTDEFNKIAFYDCALAEWALNQKSEQCVILLSPQENFTRCIVIVENHIALLFNTLVFKLDTIALIASQLLTQLDNFKQYKKILLIDNQAPEELQEFESNLPSNWQILNFKASHQWPTSSLMPNIQASWLYACLGVGAFREA